MSFVLDCSVAAAWFMIDEQDTWAKDLFARASLERACVPAIFYAEIANALCMAKKRKRLSAALFDDAISIITDLELHVDERPVQVSFCKMLDLAQKTGLTAYDAQYLELAQHLKIPLATRDAEIRKAAEFASVELIAF